jgi:hypothetical protein
VSGESRVTFEEKLVKEEDREESEYITRNDRFVRRLKKGKVGKAAEEFPSLMGLVLEDMAIKTVLKRPFKKTPIGKEYIRRKKMGRIILKAREGI